MAAATQRHGTHGASIAGALGAGKGPSSAPPSQSLPESIPNRSIDAAPASSRARDLDITGFHYDEHGNVVPFDPEPVRVISRSSPCSLLFSFPFHTAPPIPFASLLSYSFSAS